MKKVTIKDCTCGKAGSGSNLSCIYCHPVPLSSSQKGALLSKVTSGVDCATRPVEEKK